jgi:hypothetical protein
MTRVLIVVAVCACVVCVSACLGAADPSRPLVRRHGESQRAGNEEVVLVPILAGGAAGWCATVVAKEVVGCEPTRTRPILNEGCGPQEYSPHLIEAYAVTTSHVAAVSIEGGSPIPTHAESVLPDGLRAVFVEIHSQRVLSRRLPCPRFTPFDAAGKVLQPYPVVGMQLAFVLPGRLTWQSPAYPPSGDCAISMTRLPGVSPRRGSMATSIRSYPKLTGRAFLSCIDVKYHVFVPRGGERDVGATVLLDAARPGATPAPLPDMKPLPGHTTIFEAPSTGGEMVARRIPGAWLVAEEAGEGGSKGFRQPLRLLKHLHATVDL